MKNCIKPKNVTLLKTSRTSSRTSYEGFKYFKGGTTFTLNIICHFWVGTCRVALTRSYQLSIMLLLLALTCSYLVLPGSYQILPAVTHSYLLLPALTNSYPFLFAHALTYSTSLKPNKPALTFPHNLFLDITLSYTLFQSERQPDSIH